jgi:hypothetical protein
MHYFIVVTCDDNDISSNTVEKNIQKKSPPSDSNLRHPSIVYSLPGDDGVVDDVVFDSFGPRCLGRRRRHEDAEAAAAHYENISVHPHPRPRPCEKKLCIDK